VDYPILFRTIHVVRCSKFEARISTEGRALMTMEDGLWWCHGVEPGGLTESGSVPVLAYEIFREAFRQTLDDLAEESTSYDDFVQRADRFFNPDPAEARRWERALEVLRATKQVEAPFAEMQRIPPRASTIEVKLLSDLRPIAFAIEDVGLPKAA